MRFRLNEGDLLCIDWDERSLRVISAGVSRSGVQIRSAVHVPIEEGVNPRDANAFGEFIRRTMAEHRIRARRVVVDVPRQDTVLNLMSLPKGTLSELAAMVNMQIGRELPFNRDQAVVDFAIAREDGTTGTSDVWVGAVRNNVVDHLQQIISAAGLRLERIGLRPYANTAAVTAGRKLEGRTLFVDIGPSMTEIDVIRDGRLAYSRAASVSVPPAGLTAPLPPSAPHPALADSTIPLADDFMPRPAPMDMMLVEVSRTIEAYRATDPGARIDQIVLAGAGGIDEEVAQAFANRFGSPTTVFELPDDIKWRGDASHVAFSATVGLALSMLSEPSAYFNFIRPKQEQDEHRERVRRVPAIAAVVAIFVAAGIVAAYMPVRDRAKQVAALEAQVAAANKNIKARQELAKQLGDADEWQRKNVVWVDVLKQLTDHVLTTNKDAYLTKLIMRDSGQMDIAMVAVDENVATDLADAASDVRDAKDAPVFSATVGNWNDDSRDSEYPITDELFLKIRALQPKPKARR